MRHNPALSLSLFAVSITQFEQTSLIRKEFFNKRILKYGIRNAHIITGRKGEKIFQVNPYAHIQHEVEISRRYICDPVGLALDRQAYLIELSQRGEA